VPTTPQTPSSHLDAAAGRTLRLLDQLFAGRGGDRIGVRLWDGRAWPAGDPRPVTLLLRHPGALRAAFLPGTELALAEAYLYDDLDVVGDIEAVFEWAQDVLAAPSGWWTKLSIMRELRKLPAATRPRPRPARGLARLAGRRHSPDRDRRAVTYHYDVPSAFYALWLDARMVYSCAYFRSADEDLDAAQERKLEYLCRKLRLQPGQRLLDIGCGWGGLALYAAERHGVDVKGITLSEPQVEVARQRMAALGLGPRCRVDRCDYRDLGADELGRYDAIVSVGMSEHVGAEALPGYFGQAWRLLKPGGVFLNHAIGERVDEAPRRGRSFSDAYVFPDSDTTPLTTTLEPAEAAGFEIRDVENLREHYAITLRHWVRRLEARHDEALEFVDEPTYRVWRLFMSGSAHGFATGRLNVYQALLAKPDRLGRSGLPLTREDWYR
jgi:cyclopropane-fatty-acyl-phospholipid synthase